MSQRVQAKKKTTGAKSTVVKSSKPKAAAKKVSKAKARVVKTPVVSAPTVKTAEGYVDGYVLPVSKKDLRAYASLAKKAGEIWREHGALDYKECVGDDLTAKGLVPFSKSVKSKANETVVFSYIVFKSRTHRNQVNAKVMKDPRIAKMMAGKKAPFDMKRMVYGGFKVLVAE